MSGPLGLDRRALLAAAVAGVAAGCGRAPVPAAPTLFQGLLADWAQDILADHPERASQLALTAQEGGAGAQERLDDRSAAAVIRRRAAAQRRQTELLGVDPSRLSPAEAETYAAAQAALASGQALARFSFGDFSPTGGSRPYVLAPRAAAFAVLPGFLRAHHPIAALPDAEAYVTRLRAAGTAIAAETARAEADAAAGVLPPAFVLARAQAALAAALAVPPAQSAYVRILSAKLAPLSAPAVNARLRQLLGEADTVVRQDVYPALVRAGAHLEAARGRAAVEAGVWRLAEGPAYYAAAVSAVAGAAAAPGPLHEAGLARVAELTAQIDIGLRRLGRTEGTVGARLSALAADPAALYPATEVGRAALLADAAARLARAQALAGNLVVAAPALPVEAAAAPSEDGGGAGAGGGGLGAEPGPAYRPPARGAAGPARYHPELVGWDVNGPGRWSRLDLATRAHAETIPGRHLLTALAAERAAGLGAPPLLMRLLGFPAFTRGWTLYAEQLADEQGLFHDDPTGRLGMLRSLIWRAALVVVDTGLHDKRWSLARAVVYLTETTGVETTVAAAAAEAAAAAPADALAEEVGRMAFSAAREQTRTRQGPNFDLRAFHTAVLGGGETALDALPARLSAAA